MTQDELFDQLKHPNPHLRERAMWEIADLKDENTIPRLMANLGEEDVVYRRASVKALGVIGTEAVAPLVDVLLGDDDQLGDDAAHHGRVDHDLYLHIATGRTRQGGAQPFDLLGIEVHR